MAEKDREYDSTSSTLKGKREHNAEETARLKQLWNKLVRMFHPDLHEYDPEMRETHELHGGKSYDRIMDGGIIFEDCWIQWVMEPLSREGGMNCLVSRAFLPPNPMILPSMILSESIRCPPRRSS